jgi:hypothetical protein
VDGKENEKTFQTNINVDFAIGKDSRGFDYPAQETF